MDYNNFIDIYNLKNYDKQNIYNKSYDDIILNINYCKENDIIKCEIIFGDIKINNNNIQIYKNNYSFPPIHLYNLINLENILNINKNEYNNINIYNSDSIFISQEIFILEKGNHNFYDYCGIK